MNDRAAIVATAILPGNPAQPCPEVMTQGEAIRYLRLDGDKNPSRTLQYYRERGLLRATQVGRHLLYRRIELERLTEVKAKRR